MKLTEDKTRKPLSSQIQEEILQYIQTKPLKQGDKIPNEFELAQVLNVGRSTIREAIKSLVTKGVLEVRRGVGTFVVSTTPVQSDPLGLSQIKDKYKLAMDLLEVRLMIEPEIAAQAALEATQDELKVLSQLCDETEQLCRSGQDHTPKDVDFHTCIARCSNNTVVENLIPIITSGVSAFSELTDRSLVSETIETHRAITSSILNRDPSGARFAMISHLNYNRQALMDQINKEADQSVWNREHSASGNKSQ